MAGLSCAHCSQPYFHHGLFLQMQSTAHITATPSSPLSVPIPPTFMVPGMFSDPRTFLATQDHMESVQSMHTTITSSFQPWTPNSSQSDRVLSVNERWQEAAQQHLLPPCGIPASACMCNYTSKHEFYLVIEKRCLLSLILYPCGFMLSNEMFIVIQIPTDNKAYLFHCKALELHLAFLLWIQASPEDRIVNVFNETLKSHMSTHQLKLVSENFQTHLFSLTSTASRNNDLSWQIVCAKQAPRVTNYGPLPKVNVGKCELLSMPHWFLLDSGHSCGIWWNPEESKLAETPAKMTFQGMNISAEWCHSWLVARMVPGMDKKECNRNAMTGIYITNQ